MYVASGDSDITSLQFTINNFQNSYFAVRRKKDRRRSKSATPMSTNADVHAVPSDSDALSAAEKGGYDNKGYISTDASASAVDEKKAVLVHTSTEEAIADIMTDSGEQRCAEAFGNSI